MRRNRAISRGQAMLRFIRPWVPPSLRVGFFQQFVERPHAVGLGVDRVVDRQQLPGFGKQADDQPHDHPHRGLEQRFVGLGVGERLARIVPPAVTVKRFVSVRLAEETSSSRSSTACRTFSRSTLDRSACRLRDSSTASSSPDMPLLDRLQGVGGKQLPQAGQFLGAVAVIEPAVGFPLAPGLEIQARIDQPELMAVGEQAKAVAGATQQFEKRE